jgi:hypothetical protein
MPAILDSDFNKFIFGSLIWIIKCVSLDRVMSGCCPHHGFEISYILKCSEMNNEFTWWDKGLNFEMGQANSILLILLGRLDCSRSLLVCVQLNFLLNCPLFPVSFFTTSSPS